MILLVAFGTAFANGAKETGAEEPACAERGKLDTLFCDNDGDLVADAPVNAENFKDPDVLFLAYTPVEDPAVYADVFKPFLEYISEVTGKEVRYFTTQSNAAEIEALRSGRVQIAGISTGPTCFAVNLAGFVPFAQMGKSDGKYGYQLNVIVPADSDIKTLADLKGRKVAHTEETSNSGNQAPRALLPQEGIVPGEDYEVVYSGGHDTSILGVYNHDYEAACIADSIMERMVEKDVVSMDGIRVIYKSPSFPTTSWGYPHNLSPELKAKIEKAFFTYNFIGTPFEEAFNKADKFIPVDYKKTWAPIITIQEYNGVQYTFDNL